MPLTEENKYRLLVDATIDHAIYMLDTDGAVRSWNRGAERCEGYGAQEILGAPFETFFVPEDRALGLPAEILAKAREQGRHDLECWQLRKDGSRFWAQVTVDPACGDDGEQAGYAILARDLTAAKQAQETLRRSEEQFRILVQGVTDYAIYLLDPEGKVSSWNAGAQRIKGYAPREIIGKHFSTFYTDEDRERGLPAKGLATAARIGRFENEGWRVRKDGSRFWAHIVIDRILDDHGRHVGYAKITRDITARREAEQELANTREALFHAQKMEAVGQLTGGVAHDFNNLLMAIIGNLELLTRRLQHDPSSLALLNNALSGAERGATLTKRMLAFARRQELKPAALDLRPLARNLVGLMERSLGPRIGVDLAFPISLERVLVDANQLELAILNLVMNARDAMPEGGRITLGAQSVQVDEGHAVGLAPGRYVCLSVTDEGQGMDAATLERATEPFFTTKGVGKGTGLGLSMVHGLAEQSGGRLVLHSETEQGTRAEVWLPVAPTETQMETPPSPMDEPSRNGQLRVMLVDDDPLILATTAAVLEDMGHLTYEKSSANEALEALFGGVELDLLITDQMMPGVQGHQLLLQVRAQWPQLPAILASGYSETPKDLPGNVVRLAKPYGRAELMQAIDKAVLMQMLA
ncbi:PAS domain-containing sensor histidine kinase [Dyella sp. SG609]|uniref:hybrid sensor histidine kinase/response regulator n=2 Tax=unclassified Dyella TaxID=2634549 RepID=UPI0017E5DB95|nr:PAS domain-containing sensor histidine kinase [Dyella sp. SG609]NKJ20331.1 PAS domain S-box-containing protein [Dyella sp. SG609]